MARFELVENLEEECWDLIEVGGILSDEGKEDAIVARVYDLKTFFQFINNKE